MKKRKDTTRVTIEIYDEDGVLCESVGGPMTYEEIKDQMIEILRNDGIPVIRQHGKHEKLDAPALPKEISNAPQRSEPSPLTMPMTLSYEFDGITFAACGHPLDVHAANNALLKRVFDEE